MFSELFFGGKKEVLTLCENVWWLEKLRIKIQFTRLTLQKPVPNSLTCRVAEGSLKSTPR